MREGLETLACATYHLSKEYRNPGEALGAQNLARVRRWYQAHLGGKQAECATDLGLSTMAVNRHVSCLRSEWSVSDKDGSQDAK